MESDGTLATPSSQPRRFEEKIIANSSVNKNAPNQRVRPSLGQSGYKTKFIRKNQSNKGLRDKNNGRHDGEHYFHDFVHTIGDTSGHIKIG